MLKSLALVAMIQTGVIKAEPLPKCEDVYVAQVVSHATQGRTQVGRKGLPKGIIVFFGTTPNADMYGLAFLEDGDLTLVGSDLFNLHGSCEINKQTFNYFTAKIPGGLK